MTDLALQVAGSKLAISVVLGCAVWLAAAGDRRPRLCHALCLALLSALLVPPLIAIPLLEPGLPLAGTADAGLAGAASTAGADASAAAGGGAAEEPRLVRYARAWFVPLWFLGVAAILVRTAERARRFQRFLPGASSEAPPVLQREAREIARTLGLAKVPAIHATGALISPMACWSGGPVRVYIPSALLEGMHPAQLRWILAHELAHVRRRDHLVRWLEWLACTAFWWNPIAWWARRRLRSAGEMCCDAMVVRALNCDPRAYARALMRAIELVRTAPRPPSIPFASAAGSGRRVRILERRLRMIMKQSPARTRPRPLPVAVRCGLTALLATGLVYCGEQHSPTAIEAPGAGAVAEAQQRLETVMSTLRWRSPPDGGDADWTGRVPRDPDQVWIEALDLRWTDGRAAAVPRVGLVLVDYDGPVPPLENDALWAAVAELPPGDTGTGFLVARQASGGGWTFLEEVPDGVGSTLHLIGPEGPRTTPGARQEP